MINLIPPQAKKIVHREYALRVYSVWAYIIGSAVIAVAAMLIPTYVIYEKQLNRVEQTTVAEDIQEKHKEVQSALQRANTVAAQLRKQSITEPSAQILEHVESALTPEITLQSFSVTHAEALTITVGGTAQTRESLRNFLATLKRDSFFEDASVPISDLAKNVDLTFTATLTLRK